MRKSHQDNHGGGYPGTTIVAPYFHLMLHPALGRCSGLTG